MTTIASGLNGNTQGTVASVQNQIYLANGFDLVQVWNGIAGSMVAAGIAGPVAAIGAPSSTAAGSSAVGIHNIQYRYKNSQTGYVSNPSPLGTTTVVGGAEAQTFNIAASAAPIILSTDTKCDTILLEVAPVNSGNYYQVASVPNVAGSVVFNLADNLLIQQFDTDANYGSAVKKEVFTHYPPPNGTIILGYKGRGWVMGNVAYPLTGVTFTNGSKTVTGTGFNTNGSWVGLVIKNANDNVAYVIAAVASSVSMTITINYVAGTNTAAASVYSPTPNRAYYSWAFHPEEYYPAVWARDFLSNRSDILTAAIGRKEAMYIFGLFSSERLIYNDDPSAVTSVLSPIQGHRGCFNNRCLVEAEGKLYAFDRQGIYQVNEVPAHISFPVDDHLKEVVDYSQYQKFHGVYDPVDRIVMFFYVQQGDTNPKYAACVEVDTGRWFFDQFYQGITASQVVPTGDGQVRAMLGDENGFCWFLGLQGSYDGVPPTSATILNDAGGSSSSVINVTQTLPTVAPTLAGVTCYNSVTSEISIIQSNTAGQITISPAFANATTAGQELWLGAIPWEYRTKWWAGDGQEYKNKPVYLNIRMFPGSATGTFQVYIYADFQTVPTTATAYASDTSPDGTTVVNGQNFITVSLAGGVNADGFVSIVLQADWKRCLQARLVSIRPDGQIRIAGIGFDAQPEAVVEGE